MFRDDPSGAFLEQGLDLGDHVQSLASRSQHLFTYPSVTIRTLSSSYACFKGWNCALPIAFLALPLQVLHEGCSTFLTPNPSKPAAEVPGTPWPITVGMLILAIALAAILFTVVFLLHRRWPRILVRYLGRDERWRRKNSTRREVYTIWKEIPLVKNFPRLFSMSYSWTRKRMNFVETLGTKVES